MNELVIDLETEARSKLINLTHSWTAFFENFEDEFANFGTDCFVAAAASVAFFIAGGGAFALTIGVFLYSRHRDDYQQKNKNIVWLEDLVNYQLRDFFRETTLAEGPVGARNCRVLTLLRRVFSQRLEIEKSDVHRLKNYAISGIILTISLTIAPLTALLKSRFILVTSLLGILFSIVLSLSNFGIHYDDRAKFRALYRGILSETGEIRSATRENFPMFLNEVPLAPPTTPSTPSFVPPDPHAPPPPYTP